MSQEILNALTLIPIENKFLENIDYGIMIDEFVYKNTRR